MWTSKPRVYNQVFMIFTRIKIVPDDSYDIDLMENDGTYETNHVWTNKDL